MRATRRLLVASSENEEEREARRKAAGKSAGESYAATLCQLVPGSVVDIANPADVHEREWTAEDLAGYDAVFVSGSPIHVYCDTPETRRQLAFMECLFASGTPGFGSCAGLQLAVAAAGGSVRKLEPAHEAGIARGLTATEAGRDHPLLAGRPACWDALTIHGDEVERLPPGATLLATSAAVRVQAAEIRHDGGVFWGVQYHPELAPGEIAAALRRSVDGLMKDGLAASPEQIEHEAAAFDMLHRDPASLPARWQLGVGDETACEDRRRTELCNFIAHFGLAA